MDLLILFHFCPGGNLESPGKKHLTIRMVRTINYSSIRITDPGCQCSVALVSIGHYNAEALL